MPVIQHLAEHTTHETTGICHINASYVSSQNVKRLYFRWPLTKMELHFFKWVIGLFFLGSFQELLQKMRFIFPPASGLRAGKASLERGGGEEVGGRKGIWGPNTFSGGKGTGTLWVLPCDFSSSSGRVTSSCHQKIPYWSRGHCWDRLRLHFGVVLNLGFLSWALAQVTPCGGCGFSS